jgi:hypothetical protein
MTSRFPKYFSFLADTTVTGCLIGLLALAFAGNFMRPAPKGLTSPFCSRYSHNQSWQVNGEHIRKNYRC